VDQNPDIEANVENRNADDSGSNDVLKSFPTLEQQPDQTRIEALTEAIEHYPDAASNYVYRGEALLDEGQTEWAARDFTTALQLANVQAQAANWEYIYQALYDRAREGLRRAQA